MKPLLIFVLFLVTPATAQVTPCPDRYDVVKELADNWQEHAIVIGLSNTGQVMEIFASPGGKTWTVIMVTTDGRACPLAAGELLQPVPPKKGTGS